MGPPLEQNSDPGLPVHVRGTVALTPNELRQIQLFVNEIVSEQLSAQRAATNLYVVRLHFTPATECGVGADAQVNLTPLPATAAHSPWTCSRC